MEVIIDGTKYAPEKREEKLLTDAQAGWICKRRDGKYFQIDRLCSIGGMPWICYEIGGLRYINSGEQLYTKDRSLDIIHTEPLATEETPEWAWQKMLLKNRIVHCEWGKYIGHYYLDNGQVYFASASGDTRREAGDKKDWIARAGGDGWQIYEPVEPKEPEQQPIHKIQNCNPLSLSLTNVTEIVGRCLFNLAGKGEPSSHSLEQIEAQLQDMLSTVAQPVEPKEPEYIGYRKDENGKEIDVPDYQEQLEKFVVGKRVKILSYGGNLAKSGDVGVITSVQPNEGWIGIHLDSNVDVLVNYTCAEPAPRLKVGDIAIIKTKEGKIYHDTICLVSNKSIITSDGDSFDAESMVDDSAPDGSTNGSKILHIVGVKNE